MTVLWTLGLLAVGLLTSWYLMDVSCTETTSASCNVTASGPGKKKSVGQNCTAGSIEWTSAKKKLKVYFPRPPPQQDISRKKQFWNVCVTGNFSMLNYIWAKPGVNGKATQMTLPTSDAEAVCSVSCFCKKGATLVLLSIKGKKYKNMVASFYFNITSIHKNYLTNGASSGGTEQTGVTPLGPKTMT